MRILKEKPMLSDATLRFLQGIEAKIAQCTLNALYTPEELAELQQQMGIAE